MKVADTRSAAKRRAWREMRDRELIVEMVTPLLVALAPTLFDRTQPKPLAIGIATVIEQTIPDLAPARLQVFMRWWCSRTNYLEAIAAGGVRFALDGSEAGEVSPTAIAEAIGRLAQRAKPKKAA